jgi:hypothetical protein
MPSSFRTKQSRPGAIVLPEFIMGIRSVRGRIGGRTAAVS